MKVKRLQPYCINIRMKYGVGFSQKFFLTSDHHTDSRYCDRKKLKSDLLLAQSAGAKILCFGDIVDAMQGRNDRRSSKDDIRPEYMHGNYYDLVVEDLVNFYSPFAKDMLLISQGNHESSILRFNETDITTRLVQGLNNNGGECYAGLYSGWIVFSLERVSGGCVETVKLFYHHGSGMGSGTAKMKKRAVSYPDAQIIVTGHLHSYQYQEFTRERINKAGKAFVDYQTHIQLPSYKQSIDKHAGYSVEKEHNPSICGGVFLTFTNKGKDVMRTGRRQRVKFELSKTW